MKKTYFLLIWGFYCIAGNAHAQNQHLADSLVRAFFAIPEPLLRSELFYEVHKPNIFQAFGKNPIVTFQYILNKIRPHSTDQEYIKSVRILSQSFIVLEKDLKKAMLFYQEIFPQPFSDPCTEIIKNAETFRLFDIAKQYEKAMEILEQAIKQAQNQKCFEQQIEYQLQYAMLFSAHRSKEKAIVFALETAELAEKMPISAQKCGEIWSYLGNLNYGIKNYERAEQYWRKAASHYAKNSVDRILVGTMNNIALAVRKQSILPKALMLYDSALQYAVQIQDTAWIGIIAGNMGDIYMEQKDYQKAIPLLQKNVHYNLLTFQLDDLVLSYPKLAQCYIKIRQFKKAKIYLDSLDWLLLDEVKKKNHTYNEPYQLLIQTHKNNAWAAWYADQGKYTEAYEFQQKYIESYQQHEKMTNQLNLSRIQTELDVERKEKENLVLKQQAETDHAEITRQRMLNIVAIGFVIFLIGVSIIFYRMMRQRQKLNNQLFAQKEEINSQKEELHQQNEQLEQLNSTKNRLFAIISHDLRSPINNLKGVVEIMDMDLPKEQQKQILQDTSRLMDNTFQTLENLLNWAKWQMGGVHHFPQTTDIQEISYQICSLFSQSAASKKITLKNTILEETVVWADKDHIELILRNLIGNALKFTPEGGQVEVRSELFDDKVRICVSDNGVGLSEDRLSKLFDNQQVTSTRGTLGEKGTGLGLMMCKEFVEKNGGVLTVKSKEGEGTVFCFVLPKAE